MRAGRDEFIQQLEHKAADLRGLIEYYQVARELRDCLLTLEGGGLAMVCLSDLSLWPTPGWGALDKKIERQIQLLKAVELALEVLSAEQ